MCVNISLKKEKIIVLIGLESSDKTRQVQVECCFFYINLWQLVAYNQ